MKVFQRRDGRHTFIIGFYKSKKGHISTFTLERLPYISKKEIENNNFDTICEFVRNGMSKKENDISAGTNSGVFFRALRGFPKNKNFLGKELLTKGCQEIDLGNFLNISKTLFSNIKDKYNIFNKKQNCWSIPEYFKKELEKNSQQNESLSQ